MEAKTLAIEKDIVIFSSYKNLIFGKVFSPGRGGHPPATVKIWILGGGAEQRESLSVDIYSFLDMTLRKACLLSWSIYLRGYPIQFDAKNFQKWPKMMILYKALI